MSKAITAMLEQNQELDKDQLEQLFIFKSFLATVHHFFGGFKKCFRKVVFVKRKSTHLTIEK